MKKTSKTSTKAAIVKVDNSLDKYLNKEGLFKDKIDKANHVLKTVGIPRFTNS